MAALDVEPDDVYVRIVDVGPGLCAVITVHGGSSMVYDAGHWNGQHCIRAVRELITNDAIDLLVISHSDADHLGDGARIFTRSVSDTRFWRGSRARPPRGGISWMPWPAKSKKVVPSSTSNPFRWCLVRPFLSARPW
jgi:glyoxylase-like metal-dependent hydrolase (beta-lactamase superfamily II)